MPRTPRTTIPGTFVHLISRFVDGRFAFDDEARDEYLSRLGRAVALTDWILVSFALMSSHLHLGLIAGVVPLGEWLQPVHIGIAQWLNRRSRWRAPKTLGHVFADRPRTKSYETTDGGFIIAYHHLNTVSAKLVTDPRDSTWTSHRAYVGLDPQPSFLDVHRGLLLSGCSPDAAGRREFGRFVMSRSGLGLEELETLEAREALDDEPVPPRPEPAFVTAPPQPARVIQAAARAVGVPVAEVYGRSRRLDVVRARRLAVLVWWDLGGRGSEIANALSLSRSAVTRLRQRAHTVPGDLIEAVSRLSVGPG